jgi:hypothetical protein
MKYFILKGWQKSFPLRIRIRRARPCKIVAHFNFNDSCWAHKKEKSIGKVFGISTETSWKDKRPGHQRNSVRLGWMPAFDEGFISLYGYSYSDGVRASDYMGQIEVNKNYVAVLSVEHSADNLYKFRITISRDFSNDDALIIGESENSLESWGIIRSTTKLWYELNPYFGGKSSGPAPHLMKLLLNRTWIGKL